MASPFAAHSPVQGLEPPPARSPFSDYPEVQPATPLDSGGAATATLAPPPPASSPFADYPEVAPVAVAEPEVAPTKRTLTGKPVRPPLDPEQPQSLEQAIAAERAGTSRLSKYRTLQYWMRKLPMGGSVEDTVNAINLREAVKNFEAGKETPRDRKVVADSLVRGERESEKGWLRRVGDLATEIPGFALTFFATGPAYAGVKGVTATGVQRAIQALGTTATGSMAAKAAMATVPRVAGVAAQTALNPVLVAQSVTRRMVDDFALSKDDAGRLGVVVKAEGDGFMTALRKGFLDAGIELGSERAGKVLGLIPLPARVRGLKGAIVARYLGKPGNTVAKLQKTIREAGWNGVLGEMFEERVGEVTRAGVGIEELPDYASWGFLEQLSVEGAAFAGIGGASAVAQYGAGRADAAKVQAATGTTTAVTPEVVSGGEVTPAQVEEEEGAVSESRGLTPPQVPTTPQEALTGEVAPEPVSPAETQPRDAQGPETAPAAETAPLTPQERSSMLADIGMGIQTGRSSLETEQAVMQLVGLDSLRGVAAKLKTASDEVLQEAHRLVEEDRAGQAERATVPGPETAKEAPAGELAPKKKLGAKKAPPVSPAPAEAEAAEEE